MKTRYLIDKSLYDFDAELGIYSKLLKRYLKGTDDGYGYLRVTLKCTDGLQHSFMYHKVLWEYFNGETPNNYELNHKDENKHNFKLSNIELLSHADNINYGTRNKRVSEKLKGKKKPNYIIQMLIDKNSKPVYQYTLSGELVNSYSSSYEASRKTNTNRGNITSCCLGLRNSANGYKWSFNPL